MREDTPQSAPETQSRLNGWVELQMLQDELNRGPSFLGLGAVKRRIADLTGPLSAQFNDRLNESSSVEG